MIKVDDLIRWAAAHARGKTLKVLNGFIKGSDLLDLASAVQEREPFDYIPVFKDTKNANS